MAVRPEFRAYVEDQLARCVSLRSRAMFGGVGFYADDVFFGFLDGDAFYLKVDNGTRPRYEARGMEPFLAPGETMSSYWRLPPAAIDDAEELRSWVLQAVEVARRAKKPKGRRRSP